MKKKYTGLTKSEVTHNQKLYGKNEIVCIDKNKLLKKILTILKQPMFLLLVICTILYLILGKIIIAIIMCAISIVVLTSYIYQHIGINAIKKLLMKINSNTCKVIRNSELVVINSNELTIDDIIVLNKGDKVNADAIILESYDMCADESVLQKENIHVQKSYDLLDKSATLKSNYVYNETFIIKGSGIAKVTNIGNKTEYAKKNFDISILKNDSVIYKNFNKTYNTFIITSIIMFVLVLVISTINNNNIIIGILSGIVVSLSTIPIICPLTLNLFIHKYILNLSKKNAIIKKTSTLDNLDNISLLCVDKLGIITENNMIVKEFYSTIENKQALLNCALSCDNNSNDLYEKAIIEYIRNNNITVESNFKLIKKYPFTSKTKIMANIYEYNGELYIYAKGTLNGLFDICDLDVEDKYKLHNFQKNLFKNGMEVIAFASKKIDKIEEDIFKYNIDFNGLLGLYNTPKKDVEKAIKTCKNIGIKPLVICEDKKEIASFISKEIGVYDFGKVMSGKELDKINEKELFDNINNISVLSRITKKQKCEVINILKNNNDVIAITNNSTEKLDLLRKSDILISMNKLGTDISRNNADLIILDDNFTTIVNTISDIRNINIKIKKAIKFIKIINLLILMLSLVLTILNYYILLLPICIIIVKIILETIYFLKLRK